MNNNFRINTELQTPPVSLKGRVTIVAEQKEKRVHTHTQKHQCLLQVQCLQVNRTTGAHTKRALTIAEM